jgi:hypothetical protein
MADNYGDILAQEVAQRIGRPAADMDTLLARPLDEFPPNALYYVAGVGLVAYDLESTATVDDANVYVPDAIADSDAYGDDPVTAPGRLLRVGASAVGAASYATVEYTDPVAAGAATLKAATATTVAPQTILAAALLAQGKTDLAAYPRNISFTVAGGTASDAPTTVTITGTDVNDDALTETVAITASAGTYSGVKAFKTIVSVAYGAATGTGATVSIGYGVKFGLPLKPKVRAGGVVRFGEIMDGTAPTAGSFATPTTSPPNGTYTPNTAADGAHDYAFTIELDLS